MVDERIEKANRRRGRLRVVDGTTPSDALVVDALDNPEALEELCDHYAPRIHRFILKRVGNVHDAEDLTSIVFEKVLVNLDSYDSTRASFSTWIYRITLNCITDHYRRRGRRKETSLEEHVAGAVPVGDCGLEVLERQRVLLDLMDRLPPKYQQALALRYFAGMRVSEVAETLGITETAASKRVLRGLDELRGIASGSLLDEYL
ncbi:MAG: sigma-70 family RNA polymerase sigma factor [Actinomycetota bacterium]